MLFVAGLVDDFFTLSPVAKLAAQFAAAGIVLASGLTVEIVDSNVLATVLGVVWLVGITNAFNLLDNMDGLAASLAAVACAVFAVDAISRDSGELGLVVALALGGACVGFLPFNLRPGRKAVVFMGDSGSQVIGFGLASLALASSWTTAGATLTGIVLPLLVLAIPILDTTLVTVRRTLERRPVTQGGTDHSSHRLVYYGLSEQQAVAALTLAGGAARRDRARVQHAVQRAGDRGRRARLVRRPRPVRELPRRPRGALAPRRSRAAAVALARVDLAAAPARRGARRLRDHLRVVPRLPTCSSSTAPARTCSAPSSSRRCRSCSPSATSSSSFSGSTGASGGSPARATWWRSPTGVLVSVPITLAIVAATHTLNGFPLEIFVVDAVLCTALVAGSRLALRALPEGGRGDSGGSVTAS